MCCNIQSRGPARAARRARSQAAWRRWRAVARAPGSFALHSLSYALPLAVVLATCPRAALRAGGLVERGADGAGRSRRRLQRRRPLAADAPAARVTARAARRIGVVRGPTTAWRWRREARTLRIITDPPDA